LADSSIEAGLDPTPFTGHPDVDGCALLLMLGFGFMLLLFREE